MVNVHEIFGREITNSRLDLVTDPDRDSDQFFHFSETAYFDPSSFKMRLGV